MDSKKIQYLSLIICFVLHFSSLHLPSVAFTPADNYLLDCGVDGNTTVEYRNFIGDASNYGSRFLHATKTISLRDQNPSQGSSPLYHTARIFRTVSRYEFEIKEKGTHIIRLRFFSFNSQNYDLNHALFNVSVNGSSLLSNFSLQNMSTAVFKEYLLKVDSEKLEIMFKPVDRFFGFINAIEVFSAPSNLIVDGGIRQIGSSAAIKEYKGISSQILETLHRLNVGGLKITPSNDTLWRTWIPDDDFLSTKSAARKVSTSIPIKYKDGGASQEIAPDNVYMTLQEMNTSSSTMNFNITWALPVSPWGRYLIRLHFCDIVNPSIYAQLYFNVYINDYSAYEDLDLSHLTNYVLASPYHIDFVIDTNTSDAIRISVDKSEFGKNAILNGLEIMKMMNGGNLASQRVEKKIGVEVLVGSVVGGFAVLCMVILAMLLALKHRKKKPAVKTADTVAWSPLPGCRGSSHGRDSEGPTTASLALKISFSEIQFATNNFDETFIIGSGGFGTVYKGVLTDNREVAVKRSMRGSKQGFPEFMTEITVLTTIRHRHLVSLVGYCEEQSEMILVYEFMEKGSLKNHLYGSELPNLTWKQRLEICIGAAKGLHYLHTGSAQGIIHRDVKSTNILLDENYVAKVADFGISKSGPCLDESHVNTGVKGSFGYVDPEYFKLLKLTDKSDVYSFGVVLLEVLCARPAIDVLLSSEQVNLAEWAIQWQKKGLLEKIIDPKLKGMINPSSLKKFGETAEKCLAEYGVDRPTMGDVLWNLEYALQLQENWVQREPHEDSTSHASKLPLPAAVLRIPSSNIRTEEESSDGCSDKTSSQVFSQLIANEGR